MASPEPLLSVLLCVYNDELYLGEALDSILEQTFENFELILVDDGSTDASLRIAKEYQNQDSRVVVLEHKSNQGLLKSLHTGLKRCTGRYVARMDSDDISLPTRFAEQLAFLQTNLDIDLVGSNVEIFKSPSPPLTTTASTEVVAQALPVSTGIKKIITFPTLPGTIRWSMHFYCSLGHPTVMFKRSLLDVASYSTQYKYTEDYDLWTRLLSANTLQTVSFKHNKNHKNTPQ